MRILARISHQLSTRRAPIRRTAALLYLRNAGSERRIALHPCSRATAQWRTLHDFSSVRALNIVWTMPAHSSVAKVMQGTAFRRLATKAGEKYGLATLALILSVFQMRCESCRRADCFCEFLL